jgi:hypothetical protein
MTAYRPVRTPRALALALALSFAALAGRAEPRAFASREDAAKALVEACRTSDEAALRALVGEEYAAEILEDDDPGVAARRAALAKAADERLVYREDSPERVTLVIGFDAYPFPVPLVRSERGFYFDGAQGADELVDRAIGLNELTAISVLRDYVGAQIAYAKEPRDGTKVRKFATRFLSTPGERDGLYWEVDEQSGEEASPFGPLVEERGAAKRDAPYYGYRYRILTRQGPPAPGGAYSYVINGNLVAGFAAIAWPDAYGRTGVMTFLVNHYGVVYQKDLGPETAKLAPAIDAYAPDESWREAD